MRKKPDWRNWIKDKEDCNLWLKRYISKRILRPTDDELRLYLRKTDHNLSFANWIAEKHNFGKTTFT